MIAGRFTVWIAAALYAGAIIAGIALGLPPLAVALAALLPVLAVAVIAMVELRQSHDHLADLRRQIADLTRRANSADRDLALATTALRSLDEALLVVDPAGRIAACNPAAESLLGLRSDRLTGRAAEEAFTQSELLALYATARAGQSTREQIRAARPEGARVWDVSAIPLPDGGGPPGVLVCLRDATDAALALRIRADFVANASHELRTPIAAMRIALDTMSALEEGDQAMRQRLDGVLASNVARLEEMARDLLDLSRLETEESAAETEPMSLSELARELAAAYEPVCSARHLTLTFDIPPEAEHIRSSHRLLTLILGNLIDNATKFAFDDTEIRVVARPISALSSQLSALGQSTPPPDPGLAESRKLKAESPSGLRLEVTDRGVGIPLDQQQRIFERFYQVDAARTPGRRGTGLGLAIVKHAVRALGGTIRVQSVWQQGTTMTVDLPECVET